MGAINTHYINKMSMSQKQLDFFKIVYADVMILERVLVKLMVKTHHSGLAHKKIVFKIYINMPLTKKYGGEI